MPKLPYSGPSLSRLLKNQGQGGPRPRNAPASGADANLEIARLLQEGRQFHAGGEYAPAERCARLVLSRRPGHPYGLHLLGMVALSAGRHDEAVGLFRQAIAAEPREPGFYCDLANTYLQKKEPDAAKPVIRQALKLDPGNPTALYLYAAWKVKDGEETNARRLYENLLSRHPNYLPAILGLAELSATLGDFATAQTLFRKASGVKQARMRALIGLVRCEKLTRDSPEAAELKSYANVVNRSRPDEYMKLRYALGRIAENSGDYDEAFQNFAEAKLPGEVPYSLDALERKHALRRSIFTPAFFEERLDYGHLSDRPVFIVGMPRSGTTLTEQIIATHPAAAGAGELTTIEHFAIDFLAFHTDEHTLTNRMLTLTKAETQELAEKYLAVLDETSPTAARVVDKMPHNFEHLGLIRLLFPNAKIIHCRRNALDTCVSCFTVGLDIAGHPYLADLPNSRRLLPRLREPNGLLEVCPPRANLRVQTMSTSRRRLRKTPVS